MTRSCGWLHTLVGLRLKQAGHSFACGPGKPPFVSCGCVHLRREAVTNRAVLTKVARMGVRCLCVRRGGLYLMTQTPPPGGHDGHTKNIFKQYFILLHVQHVVGLLMCCMECGGDRREEVGGCELSRGQGETLLLVAPLDMWSHVVS